MATALREIIERRLSGDERMPQEAASVVLAACESAESLDAALDGRQPDSESPAAQEDASPLRPAVLESLAVAGFRGIGPEARITFTPGPGLTLVVGRNGSGKSSFAEALELLLTGANHRWEQGRPVVWKEGWRNLHNGADVCIESHFLVEGQRERVIVRRAWPADAGLDGGTSTYQESAGRPPAPFAGMGWDEPLATYRPFLPHNELGAVFTEGPATLFDKMSQILGLDELVDARKLLRDRRLALEKAEKDAGAELLGIRAHLDASGDARAAEAVRLVARKPWNLDGVEALLTGSTSGRDATLDGLKRLANLALPSDEAVEGALLALETASASVDGLSGTGAGRARQTADLLDAALALHANEGDAPCPVCKAGTLDAAWRGDAAAEVARLRGESAAADEAHAALRAASRAATELFAFSTRDFEHAEAAGIDTAAARAAAAAWTAGQSLNAPGEIVALLREGYAPLAAAISALVESVAVEVAQRDDAWTPLAQELEAWLPRAREAQAATLRVAPLKTAEKWLDDTTDEIRAERFAPISAQARAIWAELRQGSSVDLASLALEGSATRRRVAMDVTIDGQEGAALGVMSQGELNSLALSLFLPRAMSPESPFRFVVIDDPVQAMDPSKVDGLARVLAEVAKSRQVIVFTHDDRLPEAARRLRIDARHVQVFRRAGSEVEIREVRDPLSIYFEDADSLLKTSDLDPEVTRRVVPGLCRNAVEFACTEATRRRRLGRGDNHAAVEDELEQARSFNQRLALGLFDDRNRGGDVYTRINREFGEKGGNAIRQMNEGAHGRVLFHGPDLLRDARAIADWIRELP